jgi:hypothetical protein
MQGSIEEVKYQPDAPQTELTADEKQVLANKIQAMAKILKDDKIKAKYKLELIFGKARSLHRPTPGIVTFWENGTKLHGGGDVKLYLCPGKRLKFNDCEKLIPELANEQGTLVCPSCGNIWKGEAVIGELMYNLPMQKWADVIYTHFRHLEYHCDIYLKHAPDDIRSTALAQKERATFRGSTRLEKIRAVRARHIYPLRNIIKDVSAGADLLGRIHKFLVA